MHPVALGVLLLFYLSSIAGLLMSVIPSLKSWAFFAAPFYKQTALDSVQTASGRQAQVILQLNRRDPELLYKVAQKGSKLGLDHALVDGWYEGAVSADRFNKNYHLSYLQYLLETNQQNKMGEAVKQATMVLVPPSLQKQTAKVNFSHDELQYLYPDILPSLVEPMFRDQQYLAKPYYLLGLSVISKDPQLTKEFWLLAKEISPEWSFYYLELASLEQNVFHNKNLAKQLIAECNKHKLAQDNCSSLPAGWFPEPGFFAEKIEAIP